MTNVKHPLTPLPFVWQKTTQFVSPEKHFEELKKCPPSIFNCAQTLCKLCANCGQTVCILCANHVQTMCILCAYCLTVCKLGVSYVQSTGKLLTSCWQAVCNKLKVDIWKMNSEIQFLHSTQTHRQTDRLNICPSRAASL